MAALAVSIPIRPKPLIPTLTGTFSPSVANGHYPLFAMLTGETCLNYSSAPKLLASAVS
jgi:hypothetical protein